MKISAEDILKIIRDNQLVTALDKLRPDTPLFTTGLVDSFGAVTLIATIEHRLGTRIDVSRLTPQNFDTPELIAHFVSNA